MVGFHVYVTKVFSPANAWMTKKTTEHRGHRNCELQQKGASRLPITCP